MTTFNPKLSEKTFSDHILDIQNREGNRGKHIDVINQYIKKSKEMNVYDVFMDLCKDLKITVRYFSEDQEGVTYVIKIFKDGFDWFTLSYKNPKKDISELLAQKLYELVGIQVENESFLNLVIKKSK